MKRPTLRDLGEIRQWWSHYHDKEVSYYEFRFMLWHDCALGKPAHESIQAIVGCEDHHFWWRKSFIASAARNRYYLRQNLKDRRIFSLTLPPAPSAVTIPYKS